MAGGWTRGKDSKERACPRCGSFGTHVVKAGNPMPYRCTDCGEYFSVETGTPIEASNLKMMFTNEAETKRSRRKDS